MLSEVLGSQLAIGNSALKTTKLALGETAQSSEATEQRSETALRNNGGTAWSNGAKQLCGTTGQRSGATEQRSNGAKQLCGTTGERSGATEQRSEAVLRDTLCQRSATNNGFNNHGSLGGAKWISQPSIKKQEATSSPRKKSIEAIAASKKRQETLRKFEETYRKL